MISLYKIFARIRPSAPPNRVHFWTYNLVAVLSILSVNSAAHGAGAEKAVYLNSLSQGSICDIHFRPTMSDGFLAPFEISSRTGIDEFAPLDASAIGSSGSVSIGEAGAGVRTSDCLGAASIAGSGKKRDEEIVFTFDFAVRASEIMLGLVDIDWATDEPVIFLSSADSETFDYTFSGPELETAFHATRKNSGIINFGALASVSPDLFVDAFRLRETNGTTIVSSLLFVAPAANLDQAKNGKFSSPIDPPNWVNGNLNEQQAHYVEGYSIPYRVIMTDLPVGTTIVLTLGYDIKHSSAHAIDYLTHYQRLEPHLAFGHSAETVDPTIGVAGLIGGPTTFAIPAPSTTSFPVADPLCDTPTAGQPTASFSALPAGERIMSLWNGTITNITYVVEGCLTDSNSESRIDVEFVPSEVTAVLAWGGHIGLTSDWDPAGTAGDISGAPYHMRLIDWDIPGSNLGNQDRSLSASAVEQICAGLVCDDNDACTLDECDVKTGECVFTPDPNIVCNDDDACTVDTCDAMTGECVFTPDPGIVCDDSDACTDDSCDPATAQCVFTPNIVCDDSDACTVDSCDELTGECVFTPDPSIICDDSDACTDDSCDPDTGECEFTPNIVCDDSDACTIDSCDETTGECVFTPDPSIICDDSDACTDDSCDPDTGECEFTPNIVCNDDNVCTDDSCDPVTGECDYMPNDSNACSDDVFCDGEETCVNGTCEPGEEPCDDGAVCTTDSCDEAADRCDHVCDTPMISCPPTKTFECDAVGEFGDPTVDDDCSVNPLVVCTEETTPGKLPQEQTIVRTCTVTNDCGNSASCVHQINIIDTTPPAITCPPDMTFECDDIGDFGVPIVSDNCDPDPDVTVVTETIIGDCTPPENRGISPPPLSTKFNTYTARDGTVASRTGGSGNTATCVQRIDLVDTTPPVILNCPEEIRACEGRRLSFTLPPCVDSCSECEVTCVRTDGRPLDEVVGSDPFSLVCRGTDDCENESAACVVAVIIDEACPMPASSAWGMVVLSLLLLIGCQIKFARREAPAE